MEFIGQLWLPILLSGLFVFIASAIVWMALPHHKKEWSGLPNEAAVSAAMKGTAPGLYMFPWAPSEKERQSPAFRDKVAAGPAGYVTVMPPGPMSMGPMMAKGVIFNLVVAFFVAYVASHVLQAGTPYLVVFRVVGTIAFMSYAFGSVPDSIWFARPWKSWFLQAADSLLYGMVMAGTFGWLWPK